ncbi:MAG TPA: UbiD family decarboxylase [Gemmatimonadota bacterium]|nr:UbiD family decarboxylase [Gemmatimonadota bacterium]
MSRSRGAPFPDLRSFLEHCETRCDLARVPVEVDPRFEITEIVTRVVRADGPALLFEVVKGSQFPVAANILGAARRCEWALGREPEEIGVELLGVAEELMPPSPRALWGARRTLLGLRHMRVRRTTRGRRGPGSSLHAVADDLTLDDLPILTCWPEDGGRFITFPLVVTEDPATGRRNLGIYRMHVYDGLRAGMHWQIMKGGGYHYAAAEALGQPLPVAVALGADPITLLASVAPLPEGIDELAFAGFLRGAPTELVRCETVEVSAPASAEFMLEGLVPPFEREMEGPFGDHFGHYSHAAPFPVFHVGRITSRERPIYPAAVVGVPPQEDVAMGEAVAGIAGPLIRLVHPAVVDLHAWFEAGFHNLLVVSVRQRHRKEAVKTALALLGQGQLALTKVLIVVDAGVDVADWDAVLEAFRAHWTAAEDALLLPGVPQDTLDFTSFTMNLGSKLILDCTTGAGGISGDERPVDRGAQAGAGDLPAGLADLPGGPDAPFMPPDGADSRVVSWRAYGGPGAGLGPRGTTDPRAAAGAPFLVARVRERDGRTGRAVAESLARSPRLGRVQWVAVVSEDVPLDDRTLLLWGIFTRFDAARDVVFSEVRLDGAWPRYRGRMAIDATWKPGYPNPIEMDPEVVRLVDRRWGEYGIAEESRA